MHNNEIDVTCKYIYTYCCELLIGYAQFYQISLFCFILIEDRPPLATKKKPKG